METTQCPNVISYDNLNKEKEKNEKKKVFRFFTGKEVYDNREVLLNNANSERYDEFCEQMNEFWKQEKIQDQLYSSGLATVKSNIYYTTEDLCFLKNTQARNTEISSSDLVNIIDNGNALAENAVYMAEDKYDTFWTNTVLKNKFSFRLELDLFDRFISENDFYWNIGIKVTKIGRTSFADKTPCIYSFQYILFIACNDDDKTITNIKLGLEGIETDKIQKVPKKISFIESLFYHCNTYTFVLIILGIIILLLGIAIFKTI